MRQDAANGRVQSPRRNPKPSKRQQRDSTAALQPPKLTPSSDALAGDGENDLTTPLVKHAHFSACGDLGNDYY